MFKYFTSIKDQLFKNLVSLPGWRTNRKIIVIESDDWGSIRMPSKEIYSKFIENGYNISGSDYNRLDTLESNDDLMMLYEVLKKHKDYLGNHPVITANFVVGNPDFFRIGQSGFSDYYYEPVTETLKRYPNRDFVQRLWLQGQDERIFHPQFHGREHVNIVRWMEALRTQSHEILFSFANETTFSGNGDYNFMEVLDYNSIDDLKTMKQSLAEGLDLFKQIFGYTARSFIPPCYTWSSDVEETLNDCGVRYIQGLVVQSVPTGKFGQYKSKYHFLGNQNVLGQYYLIRNCFFEPSLIKTSDQVGMCLNRINIAFRWNKPAAISSHRINFMGTLDEKNRSENLEKFNDLLSRIIRQWPEVEFMTSDQLGDLIAARDQ
jgi:hypothetical protein